jgi:hypothetical protein
MDLSDSLAAVLPGSGDIDGKESKCVLTGQGGIAGGCVNRCVTKHMSGNSCNATQRNVT